MPFDDRNFGPEPRRTRNNWPRRVLTVLALGPILVLIIYYAVEYIKGR